MKNETEDNVCLKTGKSIRQFGETSEWCPLTDSWTDDFQVVTKKTANDIERRLVDEMVEYIDGNANIDYEEIHNPDDRLER